MPDNVQDAFVQVVNECGSLEMDKAKEMIKDMEKNNRLQVETWWMFTLMLTDFKSRKF